MAGAFSFKAHVPFDVWRRFRYGDNVNALPFRFFRYHCLLALVLIPPLTALPNSRPVATDSSTVPLSPTRVLREVPPDQAAKRSLVRLRGVVTFCDSVVDLGLFVHDSTG